MECVWGWSVVEQCRGLCGGANQVGSHWGRRSGRECVWGVGFQSLNVFGGVYFLGGLVGVVRPLLGGVGRVAGRGGSGGGGDRGLKLSTVAFA